LSSSYIAGAGSTYQYDISHYFGVKVPVWLVCVVYTIVIGTAVTSGARVVDHANRVFFAFNIIILASLVVLVDPSVHFQYLNQRPGEWMFIWSALPVFMTAFGFHTSIPTVVNYVGPAQPRALRKIFIAGGLIPLAAYLGWIFVSLGSLPHSGAHSFQTVHAEGSSVGVFLDQIESSVHSGAVPGLLNIFSSVVLITSYLALALSLHDIVGASLTKALTGVRRSLVLTGICFVPPLVVATVFPNGFVALLSLASIFACVMTIFFPAFSLHRLRRHGVSSYGLTPPRYHVFVGWGLYVLVVATGAALVVFQVLNLLHDLPG
jgi:tyrosine-specific transport protein